jgi:hypothetical protein
MLYLLPCVPTLDTSARTTACHRHIARLRDLRIDHVFVADDVASVVTVLPFAWYSGLFLRLEPALCAIHGSSSGLRDSVPKETVQHLGIATFYKPFGEADTIDAAERVEELEMFASYVSSLFGELSNVLVCAPEAVLETFKSKCARNSVVLL